MNSRDSLLLRAARAILSNGGQVRNITVHGLRLEDARQLQSLLELEKITVSEPRHSQGGYAICLYFPRDTHT